MPYVQDDGNWSLVQSELAIELFRVGGEVRLPLPPMVNSRCKIRSIVACDRLSINTKKVD